MAEFEVRFAEGEDRTRVEVIEAGGFRDDNAGFLVFYDDRGISTRALAAGHWQEVCKIEPAENKAADCVTVELPDPEILAAAAMVCTWNTWTKELPQVPGYYWVDRDGSVSPQIFISPRIVYVARWAGGLGFCYRIEGCRDSHDVGEPGLQWCGPIPKPMEAPPARPPKPDPPPNHGSVTGRTGVGAVPPPPPEPSWIPGSKPPPSPPVTQAGTVPNIPRVPCPPPPNRDTTTGRVDARKMP